MIRIITCQFILYFGACSLHASACRDIDSIDFRKISIIANRYDGQPFYGIYNGPAPGGLLGKDPDLKTEIEQDLLLRPGGSAGIRVVVISDVQLKGSSTYYYVFAFECSRGELRKVFEASGQGVQLLRATAEILELNVGIWEPNDSHASPSREVRILYHWRVARQRFVRQSSHVDGRWLP